MKWNRKRGLIRQVQQTIDYEPRKSLGSNVKDIYVPEARMLSTNISYISLVWWETFNLSEKPQNNYMWSKMLWNKL